MVADTASEGTVLRNIGYAFPSLSVGLEAPGDTSGTLAAASARAATSAADEQAVPMIAWLLEPAKAVLMR